MEEKGEASLGDPPHRAEKTRDQPPVLSVGLGPQFVPMTPDQQAAAQALSKECRSLATAGLTAMHRGRYAEAEEKARRAWALCSYDVLLYAPTLLAAALAAQGKYEEALQEYQALAKAGSVDPRHLLPYALLLVKMGQWAQAVSAYDTQLPHFTWGDLIDLIKKNSNFTVADPEPTRLEAAIHTALGLTYTSGSDLAGNSQRDKGLHHHQQALALEPDSAIANYSYGYSLRRIGRREEAKAAFQKAAALDRGDIKQAAEEALRRG